MKENIQTLAIRTGIDQPFVIRPEITPHPDQVLDEDTAYLDRGSYKFVLEQEGIKGLVHYSQERNPGERLRDPEEIRTPAGSIAIYSVYERSVREGGRKSGPKIDTLPIQLSVTLYEGKNLENKLCVMMYKGTRFYSTGTLDIGDPELGENEHVKHFDSWEDEYGDSVELHFPPSSAILSAVSFRILEMQPTQT